MQSEKADGVEHSSGSDGVAVVDNLTTTSTTVGQKEGGRQSLSDWYQRPEISDDSDNASNDEGEGDLASTDVDTVRPSSSPKSAQTPRRKRRSLGDWWLGNERQPSNWTPDTKVMYLGDDWNELAREWQPDSQHGSTPTRAGPAEDATDTSQRRRRRHSLHITRAPAEALPSSPSAHALAESDEQESQKYVVHLFSEFDSDSDAKQHRRLSLQTARANAKALPTSPSKRSCGATPSSLQEPKTLEVHLISEPYSDSAEPKQRRRRHSLQMTRETAEALAEVLPMSPSKCSAKATVSHAAPSEHTSDENLASLEDFIAPETVEHFLQRPASQSTFDDSEGNPATKFWEALMEILTDARAAAYDLTLYVLDPSRNDLSCLPSPDLVTTDRIRRVPTPDLVSSPHDPEVPSTSLASSPNDPEVPSTS